MAVLRSKAVTWLDRRIPPPVVLLSIAAAMWFAARVIALAPLPLLYWPGLMLIGLGLGLDMSGWVAFRRIGTTVNPLRPEKTSRLAVTGLYAWTRNPMYLGMLLVLAGVAGVLGQWPLLLGPVLFWAYIGRFQIVPEERALKAKFGPDYDSYKARVRRWL